MTIREMKALARELADEVHEKHGSKSWQTTSIMRYFRAVYYAGQQTPRKGWIRKAAPQGNAETGGSFELKRG